MKQHLVPDDLWEKISAFLEARKTGSIHLDVKDGQVLGYQLTEAGRVKLETAYLRK